MDELARRTRTVTAAVPVRCVFCGTPVAPPERCPLLPSSHWACCSCPAPERVDTGDAA
jgi:hypothetical protein